MMPNDCEVKLKIITSPDGLVCVEIVSDRDVGAPARVEADDLDVALRMCVPYIAAVVQPDPIMSVLMMAHRHGADSSPDEDERSSGLSPEYGKHPLPFDPPPHRIDGETRINPYDGNAYVESDLGSPHQVFITDIFGEHGRWILRVEWEQWALAGKDER